MEKRIIVFSGNELDEYGLPTLFKYYGVFAYEDTVHPGHFHIITRGVSIDVNPETEGHKLIEAPTAKAAVEIALANLKNHKSN